MRRSPAVIHTLLMNDDALIVLLLIEGFMGKDVCYVS